MYVKKDEAALMCPFGENKVCLKEKCMMWWAEIDSGEYRGYCGLSYQSRIANALHRMMVLREWEKEENINYEF